jgi:hypothetical protein
VSTLTVSLIKFLTIFFYGIRHPPCGTVGLVSPSHFLIARQTHLELNNVDFRQTEPEARKKFGDENVKVYTAKFTGMYWHMWEPEEREPTAYKLVCAGQEEKVRDSFPKGLCIQELNVR